MHHPIHRALVTYSDSTTGEVRVKIPTILGIDSEVALSYIGRKEPWVVPAVGDQIVVTSDDANLTNVFWVQTDSGLDGALGATGPTGPTGATGATGATPLGLPTGSITAFAGSSAPTSWLLCYGQTIVRATYPDLFAVIGTTYNTGGEAGTDFRLPDLRGRTVAGVDNMGGTDAGRLDIANSSGTVVGSQYVTLTSAQSGVPAHSHPNSATFTGTSASHNHTQDAHNHDRRVITTGGSPNNPGTYIGSSSASVWYTNGGSGYTADAVGTGSTTATNQATSITPAGSVTMTNADNTAANAASAVSLMQPTMVLNYIIKI
jgi:microcystin-dependent protein